MPTPPRPDDPILARFLARAEQLLDRLEPLLPPASAAPDWNSACAFRWRKQASAGCIRMHNEHIADLIQRVRENTPVIALP